MDTNTQQPGMAIYPIAARLVKLWTELLDVAADEIAEDDNFFSLGGNSMLLLSLHVSLMREFSVHLSIPELLDNIDFARMAGLVASKLALENSW